MDYYHTTVKLPKPDRSWLKALWIFGLFFLISEISRSDRQTQLLSPVHELGGHVFYNHNSPLDLRKPLGSDFMSQVVAIDFAFTSITDNDLEQITTNLQTLPRLSWVRFSASQVTSAAAERLKDDLAGVKIYNTDLNEPSQKVRPQFTQHDRSRIPMSWGERPI